MDDVEPAAEVNPPAVKEFPEERATEFQQITEDTAALRRNGMAINVNAFQEFIAFVVPFAARAEHRNLESTIPKCHGFFPDSAIERNRKVLNNDKDFFQCVRLVLLTS